jgi:hypothetical protein
MPATPIPLCSVTASLNPTRHSTNRPTAAIGAVNRPGNSAPAVNAITQIVMSSSVPTMTGHSGGPPQVATIEIRTYSTATATRKLPTTQNSVPVSATNCRVHGDRAVVASRSPIPRRPSRVPTQAEKPAANGRKSGTVCGTTEARTVQTAG